MKRILALLFAVAIVFSLPVTVSALNVKNPQGDFYKHGEDGAIVPYRLIVPDKEQKT